MSGKYLRKIKKSALCLTTVLIIFSFLWLPFDALFEANIASAQQTGQFTTDPNTFASTNGPGLRGYIKGLAPAIAQLPQCKEIIKSKVKTLFKNVKGVTAKIIGKKAKDTVAQKAAEKAAGDTSITVSDAQLLEKSKEATAKITELTETEIRQAENELCLKSIGRLVAKMLIQKITLSTITWIQSGYEGKPFFLQNPGKFFGDIAKNEILQFGGEISDPTLYPFGKAYLQGVVNSYNSHFQDNARYSLNELIQQTTPEYSSVSFSADFSAGGWNAWSALTSVPANNPLGFQIMASNELALRLEGTNKSTATKVQEALDQASGYLGQEVCADPEGITRAQHDSSLEAGVMEYTQKIVKNAQNQNIVVNDKPTGYIKGTCKRWEYVTPGKMIADKAQKVLGFQEDSLQNIDDLNDAVAAILDAVLAQFSSKVQEGFVKVTNEGADGSLILNQYNSDGNYVISQTELDFTPSQLNSRWLAENPDFNIRTDITQALIDEQRIYTQKLEEQNLEIPQLIMDIRQLDYCIPGPNPNWEDTSSVENFYDNINVRANLKGYEVAGSILDIALPLGGAALSSVIGFDPTAILSGVATAILEKKKEKIVKRVNARYIGDLFGVHIYGAGGVDKLFDPSETETDFGDNDEQDQVLDEGDMRNLIENTWSSYADVIYRMFFSGAKSLAVEAGAMPTVTAEARNEFERIDSYEKMAENNYDVIQTKKSVVARLSAIKDAIEALGPVPNIADYTSGGVIDSDAYDAAVEEYEALLKDPIAEFSRISNEMVSGDDIAEVDNVLKELIDKRNYVWDDLLTGPGGCEKELLKFGQDHPEEYRKYVRRQPYPLPVYYFYGTVGGEENDPNPFDVPHYPRYTDNVAWDSGYQQIDSKGDERIPWKAEYLTDSQVFTPTEGFLYGVVYWNNHIAEFVRTDLCPDDYIKLPENQHGAIVEISLPNAAGDIGGLNPDATGSHLNYNKKDYRNICGVIPRLFEKQFNVY